MGKERIVRLISQLPDGGAVIEHEDGRLERVKSQTDWARVDAMGDDEIEAAASADPDWDGLLDIDWSTVEIARPARKQPISIRLDEDILDFFKREGAGYQKRINAVLRSFVTAASKGTAKRSPDRQFAQRKPSPPRSKTGS